MYTYKVHAYDLEWHQSKYTYLYKNNKSLLHDYVKILILKGEHSCLTIQICRVIFHMKTIRYLDTEFVKE